MELETKKDIVILNYHRFGDSDDKYTREKKDFKGDLDILENSIIGDPERMNGNVIITIDDGDTSAFEIAYPLLKQYNYPAIFCISTALIGKKGYMDWEQVKQVSEDFDIASHGHNHIPLRPLDETQIMTELLLSRNIIKKNIGRKPKLLSLPGGSGSGDERIINIAKKLGYTGIFTSISGRNNPLDMFKLQRVPIGNKKYANITNNTTK